LSWHFLIRTISTRYPRSFERWRKSALQVCTLPRAAALTGSVMIGLGSMTAASAADLALPTITAPVVAAAQQPYFVRLGAVGSFFDTGLATNIAGARVPGSGGSIGSAVSVSVEAGMFLTPNIAVSVAGGWPPVLGLRGTGTFAPLGTLVKAQSGVVTLTAHYHFNDFGPIKPYIGAGIGYAIVFRDIALPATIAPTLDNNAGFVAQAGVDYALTDHIGLFVDFRKVWLQQNLYGFSVVPGVPVLLPVVARVRSDPILLSSGISYRF